MLIIRRALKYSLGALLLTLAACNLSAVPNNTPTPPPTEFIQQATSTPQPTSTPNPTTTPLPTSTSRPPATPVYNVFQSVPAPVCGLVPNVAAANIRSGPGTNYPVQGVLPSGNWIRPTRIDSGGWYQVSLPGSPVDGDWVSSTVVILQQPCVCGPNNCTSVTTPIPTFTPIGPTATYPPPADWCAMSVIGVSDVVSIYSQPSTSQGVWGNLTYGNYSNVVGRTNDGWYAIDPGVGQAPNVGIYRLRWVQTAARITLTGARCGTLPIINLSFNPTAGLCMVTPLNISNVPIYPQTTFDVGSVGTLGSGASAVVVGQTPINWYGSANGWYAIDPGAGASGVGKYRLQWIPADNTVQLNGDCADISANLTLDPF